MSVEGTAGIPSQRSWSGLRLMLFSAVALAVALCTVLFVLDFLAPVDLKKAKREGKAAVKRGQTAAEGVSRDATQGENALGAVLGSLLLMGTVAALRPVVRTRRIPPRTKWWLAATGLAMGLALVAPMQWFLRAIVRLIV